PHFDAIALHHHPTESSRLRASELAVCVEPLTSLGGYAMIRPLSIPRFLVAVALTVLTSQEGDGLRAAAPPAPPPVIDAFGDPLPEGAVARLGTARLRPLSVVSALAFGKDGREIHAIEATGVCSRWDAEGGRLCGVADVPMGRLAAFSPHA